MKFADYERIKGIVGDIYEENADFLNSIPINIEKLAEKMGFIIKRSCNIIKENLDKLITYFEINEDKTIYGFSTFDEASQRFVIYVDDLNAKENKQRFSIAHEIGHIVLNHRENSYENEKEADYFAGYLLCPDCVCINDKIFAKIKSGIKYLMSWFGISLDTAMICFQHIENRKNAKPVENNYEKIICNCIQQAVLNKTRD